MSEPEKKSDVVRRLVREQDYRSALRIVKGFRLPSIPPLKLLFLPRQTAPAPRPRRLQRTARG